MNDIELDLKPHRPLVESQAREKGEFLSLEEGVDINPYEYKIINGVYFLRYIDKDGTYLYDDKKQTFDSNSAMMSICDERGRVYVGIIENNNTRLKIGRYLRNKGFSGFEDGLDDKDGKGKNYNSHLAGHMVPLSSEIGGLDKLIDATGRAHIFHTQFSAQDRARKVLELQQGNRI